MATFNEVFQEKLRAQWFTKDRKGKFKRKRMDKEKEITGFKRVKRVACPKCIQGFIYQYSYYDDNARRQRHFSSTDFLKLKEKTKKKHLVWGVDDYYFARKTAKEVGLPLKNLK